MVRASFPRCSSCGREISPLLFPDVQKCPWCDKPLSEEVVQNLKSETTEFSKYLRPLIFKTASGQQSRIVDNPNEDWLQCAGRKGCGYVDTSEQFDSGRPQHPLKCPNCGKHYVFLSIPDNAKNAILREMMK